MINVREVVKVGNGSALYTVLSNTSKFQILGQHDKRLGQGKDLIKVYTHPKHEEKTYSAVPMDDKIRAERDVMVEKFQASQFVGG